MHRCGQLFKLQRTKQLAAGSPMVVSGVKERTPSTRSSAPPRHHPAAAASRRGAGRRRRAPSRRRPRKLASNQADGRRGPQGRRHVAG